MSTKIVTRLDGGPPSRIAQRWVHEEGPAVLRVGDHHHADDPHEELHPTIARGLSSRGLLGSLRSKGLLAAKVKVGRCYAAARAVSTSQSSVALPSVCRTAGEVPAHKERYAVQAFRECHRHASTNVERSAFEEPLAKGVFGKRLAPFILSSGMASAQQPSTLTRRRPALGRRRVLLLPIALLKTCLAVAWTAGAGDRNGRPVANESQHRHAGVGK